MKTIGKIFCLIIVIMSFSCNEQKQDFIDLTVSNALDFDREFETIEISASELEPLNTQYFVVTDVMTDKTIISQTIDYDKDGKIDVLLFQPKIKLNSKKTYKIIASTKEEIDSTLIRCYSRFVPERTDDFAWENNRVAFRTFGPTAQKMKEDGIKGGTLSSGIDAWLKRVEYPIIDKWYKKHTSGEGSYHEDTGEGLDNFHVGVSRGVGGTAVKTDSIYAVSKNFVSWEHIANGPIRTVFKLKYSGYNINNYETKETKTILLDYGQNLSRYIIKMKDFGYVSAGLTLHNNDGETTTNKSERWMSYWEPYFESELGQGLIVTDKSTLVDFDKYLSEEKDKSNIYARLSNHNNILDYYAGFGWKKSGQFNSKEDWNNYLSKFSKCLDNPLQVEIIKTTN